MSFATRLGQSPNPKDNTASGYARRAAVVATGLAEMLGLAYMEAQRQEARESAAEARIKQVSALLWFWILDKDVASRSEMIDELADALGEDISPENIALEKFKRTQAENAPPSKMEVYEGTPEAIMRDFNHRRGWKVESINLSVDNGALQKFVPVDPKIREQIEIGVEAARIFNEEGPESQFFGPVPSQHEEEADA